MCARTTSVRSTPPEIFTRLIRKNSLLRRTDRHRSALMLTRNTYLLLRYWYEAERRGRAGRGGGGGDGYVSCPAMTLQPAKTTPPTLSTLMSSLSDE